MPGDMTVAEAAARKGVTPQAVRRAIHESRLKARIERRAERPSGVWRLRAEDVEAWRPARTPAERASALGRRRTALARRDAIARGYGALNGPPDSVEAFLKEKHADIERENARGW